MNCRNKFKLTTIAMMVGYTMSANAALYEVIEVSPEDHGSNGDYQTAYGVAIQPGDVSFELGCFDTSAGCQDNHFKLAIETRTTPLSAGQAVDGVSYREEVPFAMDARFGYLDYEDDFETYCYYYLGYNTCETWAQVNYKPWYEEKSKNFTPNALAYVEGGSDALENTFNYVINSLTADAEPVGNRSVIDSEDSSVLETRNQVVAPNFSIVESLDEDIIQSRAWKIDGTFTVGSVSRSATNTNGTYHTSKAAIWDQDGSVKEIDGPSNDSNDNNRLAQGSMRDLTVVTNQEQDVKTIYGVGYNTYSDNNYLNATVFKATLESGESINSDNVSWTSKEVAGARQKESGDVIHSNSRLTGVNSKLVGIGEAKLSEVQKGAYANRLFIVKDVSASSLSASYLNSGIFFSGAGGKMGAINNYNEIVGQLDADSTREDDGKPRRKRGFIYPYTSTTTTDRAETLFDSKAWFLDDLTHGDDDISEANNEFRIIDATGINDAGAISGTAFKCAGGYNSTAHNATCDDIETIVAVKLMPIGGKTQDDIVKRSIEEESATRQGAGLGWLALTMLGLFGFRRR